MLETASRQFDPQILGIEVFQPGFRSRSKKGGVAGGTAGAAKTLAVYGGAVFWALTHRLFVAPFLPSDLKRRFCGRQSASKQDVLSGLCQLVDGLEDALSGVTKSKREHVADAAGHAYLALEEIDRMRVVLGLQ